MKHAMLFAAFALAAGCQTRHDPDTTRTPPKQSSPFVQSVLANPRFKWQTTSSEHFYLNAPEGSFAATRLSQYRALAEDTRDVVLARLGIRDTTSTRTNLFFVDSPDDIKAIVGQPAGGWTEPTANAVLFVVSAEHGPPIRHELGHLYSHRNWGTPSFPWISEGVAEYAVGDCEGVSLATWMKSILTTKVDVPLAALEANFDYTRAAPTLEAGSFAQYVADRYGNNAVRALFLKGLAGLQEATGTDAAAVEKSWRAAIDSASMNRAAQAELDPRGRVRCES